MTRSESELLLGYLLGALEDADRASLEKRLRNDPSLLDALNRARALLRPLSAVRDDEPPPPGLAQRTCRLVSMHPCKPSGGLPPRPAMSAESAVSAPVGRFPWPDAAVAVGVLFTLTLLIVPAVHSSRQAAAVLKCQDNLREVGLALDGYSQLHEGYFPAVPTQGRQAVAGIYAQLLLRDGLLADQEKVICPASPLAANSVHIPSLEELYVAQQPELPRLQHMLGGSYGYNLGHMRRGMYQATRNLRRPWFALVADAPSPTAPERQSLNHGGRGQNVLFEDGQVKFLSCSRPSEQLDDIFVNDEGQVAAGVQPDDAVIGPSEASPLLPVAAR